MYIAQIDDAIKTVKKNILEYFSYIPQLQLRKNVIFLNHGLSQRFMLLAVLFDTSKLQETNHALVSASFKQCPR